MDTSAINDAGMGWISADDLADLDADYVQADDEALYKVNSGEFRGHHT